MTVLETAEREHTTDEMLRDFVEGDRDTRWRVVFVLGMTRNLERGGESVQPESLAEGGLGSIKFPDLCADTVDESTSVLLLRYDNHFGDNGYLQWFPVCGQ